MLMSLYFVFSCNKTQGYSLSKEKEKSLQKECSSLELLLKNSEIMSEYRHLDLLIYK